MKTQEKRQLSLQNKMGEAQGHVELPKSVTMADDGYVEAVQLDDHLSCDVRRIT